MAGKPAEPGHEQEAERPARLDTGEPRPSEHRERVGPLAIERRAKADGRALILYSEDPAAVDRR